MIKIKSFAPLLGLALGAIALKFMFSKHSEEKPSEASDLRERVRLRALHLTSDWRDGFPARNALLLRQCLIGVVEDFKQEHNVIATVGIGEEYKSSVPHICVTTQVVDHHVHADVKVIPSGDGPVLSLMLWAKTQFDPNQELATMAVITLISKLEEYFR